MKEKKRKKKRVIPGFGLSFGITIAMLGFIVVIPLCTLVIFSAKLSFTEFITTVTRPRVLSSYRVSLETALIAALIDAVMGTILAWVLVRYNFPGKQIMNGELKAGEALPSIRSLAKSLQISVLTVQKAYDLLQSDGFIETTAGKGCYVSVQNQDFYLEEQQKKIEEHFNEAIEIARTSGIPLNKLLNLLTLLYEED